MWVTESRSGWGRRVFQDLGSLWWCSPELGSDFVRVKRDKALPRPLCLTPFPGSSGLVLPPCPQQKPVPAVWDGPGASLCAGAPLLPSFLLPHCDPVPPGPWCEWPLAMGKLFPLKGVLGAQAHEGAPHWDGDTRAWAGTAAGNEQWRFLD